MKKDAIMGAYQDYILPTYTKTPLIFVKGKASHLWDIHGREYLDFFPGWGVNNLGHCHPKVMQAVRDQISKLIFIPNNYYHIPQAQLAEEFVRVSFEAKVFFCNSGAEANEAAIKFSRKFGRGRYEIITFENSFHGRTMGALAATAQKKYQEGFAPLPQGFVPVPFNDLSAVQRAVTDKTVAIMLELIQGEGGVNVATDDFIKGVRRLCDERNLLLIVDEVQTGIGRTGTMFCYQQYGVTPDILTVAKALGGGLPIGIMAARKDIADTLGPGMHATTFGGGPVIARAALAVLRTIQKDHILAHVREMGQYLFTRLGELQRELPVIKEVRGRGLMVGVALAVPGKPIVEKCIRQGLLINCTHDTVLRLMPALIVRKKDIDSALRVLCQCLKGL